MKSGFLPSTHTALMALIFAVTAVNIFFTLPFYDLAWLSLLTSRLLDGATLYRDIIDTAPPLIFWLYALPVAIAKAFSWPEVLAVKYAVLIAAAASIAACASILKHSPLWTGKERRSLMLGIAGILLLLSDNYAVFGQREHLLVIFTLPYFLALLPSIPPASFSRPVKIALGAAAALGLCIKPYFFIIWAAAMAYRLRQIRSVRAITGPAEITIVLMTFAYIGTIMVFTPYYFDWLRIFAPIYGYFTPGDTATTIILCFIALAATGILLAWAFGLPRLEPTTPYRHDVFFLAAIAAGAYAEALSQFKLWWYIVYPFEAFGILALLPVIVRKPANNFLAFAVMALAFYPTTPLNDTNQDMNRKGYAVVMQMLAPYRNYPDLYFLGSFMAPPPVYRDATPLEWKGKFHLLNYLLFGIMENSPVTGFPTQSVRPGQEWRQQWLLQSIADDVEQKHPSLIVIASKQDPSLPAKDQYIDLGRWLAQNDKFARLLSHYDLAEEKNGCPGQKLRCPYRIYTYRHH